MRILYAVAAAAWLGCGMSATAQRVDCGQALDAPLKAGSALIIDSRPAGLEIKGVDTETIHVTCTASVSDVRLTLSGDRLEIKGGRDSNANVEVRIEVPKRTSLQVQMGAGEVKVENVKGDKDIDLYAGQITISQPEAWNYRAVDASVDIGEVNASAFGADKGGFFRHFSHRDGAGEYRLHVHVMTGEIDLLDGAGRGGADQAD